jgi:putative tricarboxylic transport membrane protein
MVFAAMGPVAANPSVVELLLLVGFGAAGFLMRRYGYPIAPAVVGLILGPMADLQLRRALQISLGDPLVLVQHWSSALMLTIAAIALIAPFIFKNLSRFQADED